MKKAKILLGAIIVSALAGGGLAFKAQRFNAERYCTTNSTTTACSFGLLPITGISFTVAFPPPLGIYYTIAPPNVTLCDNLICPFRGQSIAEAN